MERIKTGTGSEGPNFSIYLPPAPTRYSTRVVTDMGTGTEGSSPSLNHPSLNGTRLCFIYTTELPEGVHCT